MDVEDVVVCKSAGWQWCVAWKLVARRGGTEGKIDTDEKGTCPVAAAIAASGRECRVPHICKSAPPIVENAQCTHPPLVQQTKQFLSVGH